MHISGKSTLYAIAIMVAPLVALQTVIGWTGSVAGSVNFMWAFWQMFEFSGPEIQVKVGLEGPGCSQFGGVLQGVAAFDEYNELRGTREFGKTDLSTLIFPSWGFSSEPIV